MPAMGPGHSMNRRLLFLAYFFPPLANSGTQRAVKFANHLPDFGWDPLVVTVAPTREERTEPDLLKEIRSGTQVWRVPMLNEAIADAIVGTTAPLVDVSRLADGLSWRLRERFHCPDLCALWGPTVVREARKILADLGFDAILATGFPWSALVAARDLSRLTGKPFVADFRDHWVAEDLFAPTQSAQEARRSRTLELSVLREAGAVTTAYEAISAELRQRVGTTRPASPVVTIPNGYDPADLAAVQPAARSGERLRIVYAGVWKPGYTLQMLFEAIETLTRTHPEAITNLEVVTVGYPPGYAERFGIGSRVTELGPVSHHAALRIMRSADILYLMSGEGRRATECVPGKAYECAATGRPILAVTSRDGAMARFLDQVGRAIVIEPQERERLARVLVESCQHGRLQVPPARPGALEPYSRVELTRRLAAVLDEVVASHVESTLTRKGGVA